MLRYFDAMAVLSRLFHAASQLYSVTRIFNCLERYPWKWLIELQSLKWLLAQCKVLLYIIVCPWSIPSEEIELTANSLGAHIETHGQLILRTLNYPTMNSQDDSHCELSVCELFVRSSWWAHHAVVSVSSLCELQTHRKTPASSQCGSSWELTGR